MKAIFKIKMLLTAKNGNFSIHSVAKTEPAKIRAIMEANEKLLNCIFFDTIRTIQGKLKN
jgi:hypothetical protein